MQLLKYIKNPRLIYCWASAKGLTRWVPDEIHLKLIFRAYNDYPLDLDAPQTFNAKIQWLKLHDKNPDYVKLVDKYAVKEWVADRIGEEVLAKTYAVWANVDDIDLSILPDSFVLKTNHDCGGVVICRDRNSFDFDSAKQKLRRHLATNYYWGGREWPYKNVKPLVFAEEYLDGIDEEKGFTDYKFMCFNGDVKCAFTCTGRENNDLRVDFFTPEWLHLPFTRHYPNADIPPSAPKNLSKMIEFSMTLSRGIPFVRVDFYEVRGSVYFGEMTFYPGGGFEEFDSLEWDRKLGSWIDLGLVKQA